MGIVINLKQLMMDKGETSSSFVVKTGLSKAKILILKQNKARLIRFSTLNIICKILNCQPGDLLKYIP